MEYRGISRGQVCGSGNGDHLEMKRTGQVWSPAVGAASPELGLRPGPNAAGLVLPDLLRWEKKLQTGFYGTYLDF